MVKKYTNATVNTVIGELRRALNSKEDAGHNVMDVISDEAQKTVENYPGILYTSQGIYLFKRCYKSRLFRQCAWILRKGVPVLHLDILELWRYRLRELSLQEEREYFKKTTRLVAKLYKQQSDERHLISIYVDQLFPSAAPEIFRYLEIFLGWR